MTTTKVVDNRNRPAQPEPGEDEAVQSPSVRETAERAVKGGREASERAQDQERDRQTGE